MLHSHAGEEADEEGSVSPWHVVRDTPPEEARHLLGTPAGGGEPVDDDGAWREDERPPGSASAEAAAWDMPLPPPLMNYAPQEYRPQEPGESIRVLGFSVQGLGYFIHPGSRNPGGAACCASASHVGGRGAQGSPQALCPVVAARALFSCRIEDVQLRPTKASRGWGCSTVFRRFRCAVAAEATYSPEGDYSEMPAWHPQQYAALPWASGRLPTEAGLAGAPPPWLQAPASQTIDGAAHVPGLGPDELPSPPRAAQLFTAAQEPWQQRPMQQQQQPIWTEVVPVGVAGPQSGYPHASSVPGASPGSPPPGLGPAPTPPARGPPPQPMAPSRQRLQQGPMAYSQPQQLHPPRVRGAADRHVWPASICA